MNGRRTHYSGIEKTPQMLILEGISIYQETLDLIMIRKH